jgi:NAD(P)-dependent dehydrogenase (short-subunit alcohol dehydrogenase family)
VPKNTKPVRSRGQMRDALILETLFLCALRSAEFFALKGINGGAVYFASKAAVRSLARTLAAELGPRGIRVNALSPGLVPTALFGKTGLTQEQLQGLGRFYTDGAPLSRLGEADEIASAAMFLERRFFIGHRRRSGC